MRNVYQQVVQLIVFDLVILGLYGCNTPDTSAIDNEAPSKNKSATIQVESSQPESSTLTPPVTSSQTAPNPTPSPSQSSTPVTIPQSTPSPVPSSSPSPSPSPSVTPSPTPSSTPTPYAYSGGSGSQQHPYLISNPTDFNHINDSLGSHFQITHDIDMTGVSSAPIGSVSKPFSGVIYGDSHSISNITISLNDSNSNNVTAVFGALSGTVTQLKFLNSKISNNLGYASGIAGYLLSTSLLSNCSINGSITSKLGGNGVNVGLGNYVFFYTFTNAEVFGVSGSGYFNGSLNTGNYFNQKF